MIYGTPAPLLTLCPSTFSAASPECGRTLLSLLATLSAALPAVFASVTVVVLAALLTATAQAQDATSTDGICGRTEQVRTALLAQIPGVDTCGAVTDAHLAAITGLLNLSETSLPSLQAGDFDGLTGLMKLYLSRTGLETLPAGVFSDLTSLKNLLLESNELVTLPPRVFEDLTVLYELRLHSNQLKALREDVFASLSNLRTLDLEFNELPTLPTGVFSGLRLIFLGLESNELRTLRAGMFTGLNVETLDLSHNDTSSVAPETFNGLSWLKHLDLGYNQLETLPAGVLDGLTNLLVLWLEENPGTDFTFTMSVERKPGTNNAVVTVPQGGTLRHDHDDKRQRRSATRGRDLGDRGDREDEKRRNSHNSSGRSNRKPRTGTQRPIEPATRWCHPVPRVDHGSRPAGDIQHPDNHHGSGDHESGAVRGH